MAMNRLEQRVNKLEEAVPGLPCPNPEHRGLGIFIKGESVERDRENDRLIKSLEECEHCRKQQRVIIILQRYDHPHCPTCGAAVDRENGESGCNGTH